MCEIFEECKRPQPAKVRGLFTTATNGGGGTVTVNHVAKWNGSAWSALGAGMNERVRALAISGGNLYAGGGFTTADATVVNRIAKWNGSGWSALGLGMGSGSFGGLPDVHTLVVSDGNLFAGSWFRWATNNGGAAIQVYRMAKWNGSSWSALGSGVSGSVYGLAATDCEVFAAGEFGRANSPAINSGDVVNYIARWDGQTWSPLGSGLNNHGYALAIARSNLYVGGLFTMAGGEVSGYAARAIIPVTLIFLRGSLAVSNGYFQARLTGPENASVIVDSSADLFHWTPIATNTLLTGGWQLSLPISMPEPRFYRARFGP